MLGACDSPAVETDAGLDATAEVGVDGGKADAHVEAAADVVAEAAPSDAGAPTDAGGPDVSYADASGCGYAEGGSQCNALPWPTTISVGCVSGVPAVDGGAIADGLYFMTQAEWDTTYFDGGCPSSTWASTVAVCGSTLQWFDINDVKSDYIGTLTISTAASQITFTQSCPSPQTPYSFSYSTDGTNLLVLFAFPKGPTLVMHFTRQ